MVHESLDMWNVRVVLAGKCRPWFDRKLQYRNHVSNETYYIQWVKLYYFFLIDFQYTTWWGYPQIIPEKYMIQKYKSGAGSLGKIRSWHVFRYGRSFSSNLFSNFARKDRKWTSGHLNFSDERLCLLEKTSSKFWVSLLEPSKLDVQLFPSDRPLSQMID